MRKNTNCLMAWACWNIYQHKQRPVLSFSNDLYIGMHYTMYTYMYKHTHWGKTQTAWWHGPVGTSTSINNGQFFLLQMIYIFGIGYNYKIAPALLCNWIQHSNQIKPKQKKKLQPELFWGKSGVKNSPQTFLTQEFLEKK